MKLPAIAYLLVVVCVGYERPYFGIEQDATRTFDCHTAFRAGDDFVALQKRFGESEVMELEIDLGEGFREKGAVVFPNSAEDRVEVRWRDPAIGQGLKSVHVKGKNSKWRTSTGLAVGDHLQTVERLNRKPFRLSGFGWDHGGTTLSWEGGRLESSASAPCAVRVRLQPDDATDYAGLYYRQVSGDRQFSSGHPAMQSVNPTVSDIWLVFKVGLK